MTTMVVLFKHLQFLSFVFIVVCGEKLTVTPKDGNQVITSSVDSFTNTNKGKIEFCSKLNATCVNNKPCDECRCKKHLIWIDYTQGCKNLQYLDTITNGRTCFKFSTNASWVPTIQENTSSNSTFPLYVADDSSLPTDIQEESWNCKTEKAVWLYNVSIPFTSFADGIRIENSRNNKTLQFTKTVNLSALAGMLLKLDISCSKQAQNVSSCLVFKVAGIKEIGVSKIRKKDETQDDSDDDVMDIVKPVVIVASILIVLVGVFFYILYKRREFIKEQKERKISEAPAPLPGWINHAARNAAKMSTVTVLSEDILYEQTKNLSIQADSQAINNEAFDEKEEDFISNQSNNPQESEKDNSTTNHINNNNNNNSLNEEDTHKTENNELNESPKTMNLSNGHVSPLKEDTVDSPHDLTQETQLPDDTVIHIPENDDEDEIGEPIGNSTRKSDDVESGAKTMVHDVSGSSLPSLSGSLVNDDFFGQMMNEYDRINTLPRK